MMDKEGIVKTTYESLLVEYTRAEKVWKMMWEFELCMVTVRHNTVWLMMWHFEIMYGFQ